MGIRQREPRRDDATRRCLRNCSARRPYLNPYSGCSHCVLITACSNQNSDYVINARPYQHGKGTEREVEKEGESSAPSRRWGCASSVGLVVCVLTICSREKRIMWLGERGGEERERERGGGLFTSAMSESETGGAEEGLMPPAVSDAGVRLDARRRTHTAEPPRQHTVKGMHDKLITHANAPYLDKRWHEN